MPVMSLSSVLLPEPLCPMMPKDSPSATVKEMSRSAQKSLLGFSAGARRENRALNRSRRSPVVAPRRNFLDTSWTSMTFMVGGRSHTDSANIPSYLWNTL